MAETKMHFHVGCSGWSYDGWKGTFYPRGMPISKELAYYASVFDVVEIDSTFYNIPRHDVVQQWHDKTPAGFMFVAKMFQGITHKLHEVASEGGLEQLVERYFAALAPLEEKLQVVVIQFPPRLSMKYIDDVTALVDYLPSTRRFAIEFRDSTWFDAEPIMTRIRGQQNFSIAGSIHPDVQPFIKQTADFFVFRFIGDRELSSFGTILRDKEEEMKQVKASMDSEFQDIRDTFVFFNNHYAGFGPASANLFKQMVGLQPVRFGIVKGQASLGDFMQPW